MRFFPLLTFAFLATAFARNVGQSCNTNNPCTDGSSCSSGICGGSLASCSPTSDPDFDGTGPTTQCATGLNCLRYQCRTLAPRSLGQSCSDNAQCPGGSSCASGICGGVGAFCRADDNRYSTGVSTTFCAPNLDCVNDACSTNRVKNPGQACTDTTPCALLSQCSNGFCGGEAAFCQPDEYDPNNPGTGASAQCSPGSTCLRGQCSSQPVRQIGQSCSADYVCEGLSYCSNGICGGDDAFCTTAENDGFGSAPDYCASGTCVGFRCTSTPIAAVGESCAAGEYCDNGSTCSNDICGGSGASCSPTDGDSSGTGPSAQCASGSSCLRYQCSSLSTKELGDACTIDNECPGSSNCASGICGGVDAFCNTPENDGFGSAPEYCATGLNCIGSRCSATPISTIGQSCANGEQCDQTYCGTDGICGGVEAYCNPDVSDGTGTGPSSQCVRGSTCIRNQCSTATVKNLGDACSADLECPTNTYCKSGICGGVGAFCTADGGGNDGTGVATQTCAANLDCINYACSALRVKQPGEACTENAQCDDNSSCGTDGICGGQGAYCSPTPFTGPSTGPSDQCAPGNTCLRYQCSNLPTKQLGETCSIDNQCPENTYCSNGVCGGVGASCVADGSGDPTGVATEKCAPGLSCQNYACSTTVIKQPGEACTETSECDDNSVCSGGICGGEGAQCYPDDNTDGDGTGASAQCAPGKQCLRYICSSKPIRQVGEDCDIDNQCPNDVFCSSDVCGGMGAFCTSGALSTGPSEQCASGQCDKNSCTMAPSNKPRKRDIQRIMGSKCRKGYSACPVLSGRGYECIDTLSNIESCGGCMFGVDAKGADCTSILNADIVNCVKGSCVVESCIEGYTYLAHNATCVEQ